MTRRLMVMLVGLAVASWGATSWADDEQKPERSSEARSSSQSDESQHSEKETSQSKSGPYLKAGDLQGMAVRDQSDNEIGEISDVLVSLRDGKVILAAISSEQAEGDQLIALPWQKAQLTRQDDEYHVTVDISQEQLSQAPTFKEENWAMAAEEQFLNKFAEHYQIEGQEIQRAFRPSEGEKMAAIGIPSAELNGITVVSQDGQELGDVEDVVLDAGQGSVLFVSIDSRAIPMELLRLQPKGQENQLVISMNQQEFEQIPQVEDDVLSPEVIKSVRDVKQATQGSSESSSQQQEEKEQKEEEQKDEEQKSDEEQE